MPDVKEATPGYSYEIHCIALSQAVQFSAGTGIRPEEVVEYAAAFAMFLGTAE